MNDFSKPDDSGGPRPAFEGRYEVSISSTPPNPDPLPCSNGRYVVVAGVTQRIAKCADAQYFGLYNIAVAQIDARLAKIQCAVGCQRFVVEMFRSWKCRNTGTEANPVWKATVIVAKAVYCAEELPTPERWLRPALQDTFTNSPGAEPAGVQEPNGDDLTTEEIGQPTEMVCGETRTFFMKYIQAETACPNVTDYKKYVDAANERLDTLAAAIKCTPPCVQRKTIEWSSWKCENRTVIVEIYFKLECVQPPPGGARPGCLGMLLGMK